MSSPRKPKLTVKRNQSVGLLKRDRNTTKAKFKRGQNRGWN